MHTMKLRFALMSIFMLLPLQSEAKEVYVALLTEAETRVKNLDEFDDVIRRYSHDIDYYCAPRVKDSTLVLKEDQMLVIRGGRGSINARLIT